MRRQCLPIEQWQAWSHYSGIELRTAAVTSNIQDGSLDKGAGLVATVSVSAKDDEPAVLLSVPSDLILSKVRVQEIAKTDKYLRDVLNAVGEFAQKPRGAILIFLLLQVTHASPDIVDEHIGVANAFTDYVKMLPVEILLPTFYTAEERELLEGTSLRDAVEQKLVSLEQEFERLRKLTQHLHWCQKHWWDEEDGCLTFDDWKQVDAMYRSRALDLPGIGDAMVPLVDMANHASDGKCNARFDIDDMGSALLVLRDTRTLKKDEEITITYGAGGACEMIFSYGFLEPGTTHAREMLLNLDIPSNDPLRLAKKAVAKEAPGVRLFADRQGSICWESNYVWWACINEEDGLSFQVLQSIDGGRELKATWKNRDLDPSTLEDVLSSDELADVFRLRAIVTIQERLEQQGAALEGTNDQYETAIDQGSVRPLVWETIGRLRILEHDLLSSAFETLELEKTRLLTESGVVQTYLQSTDVSQLMPMENRKDDFS